MVLVERRLKRGAGWAGCLLSRTSTDSSASTHQIILVGTVAVPLAAPDPPEDQSDDTDSNRTTDTHDDTNDNLLGGFAQARTARVAGALVVQARGTGLGGSAGGGVGRGDGGSADGLGGNDHRRSGSSGGLRGSSGRSRVARLAGGRGLLGRSGGSSSVGRLLCSLAGLSGLGLCGARGG